MTPAHALSNIRHTAKQLPASVGSHHRSTLYEAAEALEDTTKEMLTALKALLGVDNPPAGEPGHVDYRQAVAIASAVISRAEGTGLGN